MSSKKLITYTTTAFVAVVLSVMACKKGGDVTPDTTVQENTDYGFNDALIEQQFDELQSFADQSEANGSLGMKGEAGGIILGGSCAEVSVDTGAKTIMIDFGKQECLCKDGRKRQGIINISYTGKYSDSGSVRTITFTDYYVNGNQLIGSKTVTNMGYNKGGQRVYKSEVGGGMVLTPRKDTIWAKAIETRTMVGGQNTPVFIDDAYNITGSGTFSGTDHKQYNTVIKAPLSVALSCNWIKAGVIEFSTYDNDTRALNFGDEGCEDRAVLTVNGKATDITLK